MAVHVVTHGLVPVGAGGSILPAEHSIAAHITMNKEDRVLPDASVANSAGYPTIAEYLADENAAGFLFKHLDQTYIITEAEEAEESA